jgi:hypothetical protein
MATIEELIASIEVELEVSQRAEIYCQRHQ